MHFCENKNYLGAHVKNDSNLTAGLALDILFSLLIQKVSSLLSPAFHGLNGALFRYVSCRSGPVWILSTLFTHCLLAFIFYGVGCVL